MSVKVGILVSGRGSNMVSLIQAEKAGMLGGARVVLVISDVAKAPALEKARELGVEAIYIPTESQKARLSAGDEERIIAELENRGVGLVCLAGFMRIIGERMLKFYAGRILNIHPSLLPSFPGLGVQKKAVDYGVRYSGCTVHFVTADVDCGPIIIQAVVPVLPEDDAETLAERILVQEHRIYPQAVSWYAQGKLSLDGRRVGVVGGYPWQEYMGKEK
jgi:phosphoribosylglycinamide formyltransferase-1